jgi:hypothetical protein
VPAAIWSQQPLRELPEPQKMDHKLMEVHAINKMANAGSSCHCLGDLGISQPPQRDMPRDFARYVKVGEVDAEC